MNQSLNSWNTFGINKYANKIVCIKSVKQLLKIWKNTNKNKQPVLILGEGSNVLFIDNFNGTVIANRIMGIKIAEDKATWYLHIKAGENWHKLVHFTIKNNMPGLENLALIPGSVGSSPIQNIGAYGIELKQVCQYVDCIELSTGASKRLDVKECRLSYRDSIFQHEYKNKFVITAIGLKLSKHWEPILNYGDLKYLNRDTVSPKKIFNFVCKMRMNKLPDPKVIGNAGSFFKNPIISMSIAKDILSQWPDIPHQVQTNGHVKLAAAWLIDRCKLRGVSFGGAAIHSRQALVIINKSNATSKDIIYLAHLIRKSVGEKFNIWLEPEVCFIGATGIVDAVEIIA